ncbi:putative quorum-sensing-regulated virulence factor [Psychromonas sp.]
MPEGKLNEQLALVYELKLNELEKMLAPLNTEK